MVELLEADVQVMIGTERRSDKPQAHYTFDITISGTDINPEDFKGISGKCYLIRTGKCITFWRKE